MANIKQQKKRVRTNEARRVQNMEVRSRMRTLMKQALQAIDAKDADGVARTVPSALQAIDRAAKKGVIHQNSAARKKSTLQHRAATGAK